MEVEIHVLLQNVITLPAIAPIIFIRCLTCTLSIMNVNFP